MAHLVFFFAAWAWGPKGDLSWLRSTRDQHEPSQAAQAPDPGQHQMFRKKIFGLFREMFGNIVGIGLHDHSY